MSNQYDREQKLKLIAIVREAIERDKALREQHEVGDKFRFIRERLNFLLEYLEKSLQTLNAEKKETQEKNVETNEFVVYVYLYNTQGLVLRSWQPMLTQKVFYEYGFNRPIYGEKSHVEAMIRSKPNRAQHAYVTVAIKQESLISQPEETKTKDSIGNPLLKLKEGALRFE